MKTNKVLERSLKMNKGFVKGVLIFATGVGVGALIATIVLKKKQEREQTFTYVYNVKDDGEVVNKDYLDNYRTSTDEEGAAVKDLNEERVKRTERPRSNPYGKLVGGLGYAGEDIDGEPGDYVDPAELASPTEDEEETDGKDYYDFEKKTEEANNHSPKQHPYVITVEQFGEEMDHYDKITIYFYEDDEVLTDENEEVITDVSAIVGDDALYSFGDGSGDAEIVYVRNDKMQIDYEVIRLSKSYAETVCGFTDGKSGGRR
jgi:hypothetical protein